LPPPGAAGRAGGPGGPCGRRVSPGGVPGANTPLEAGGAPPPAQPEARLPGPADDRDPRPVRLPAGGAPVASHGRALRSRIATRRAVTKRARVRYRGAASAVLNRPLSRLKGT